MVDRHARVRAFARAHFSSASARGNVPSAIVFPAHYEYQHVPKCAKNEGSVAVIIERSVGVLRSGERRRRGLDRLEEVSFENK
jgi:hypothetical protein